MRIFCITMMISLALSLAEARSKEETKYIVSKSSLTSEEIAIYREVLENHFEWYGTLSLADKTEPFDRIDGNSFRFDKEAESLKGVIFYKAKSSSRVVHRINPEVISNQKIILVNKNSVERTYGSGILTLSEIVFDRQQLYALVAYDYYVGPQSGSSQTMVFKKDGEKWKLYLIYSVSKA
jgi:hypothetical protein